MPETLDTVAYIAKLFRYLERVFDRVRLLHNREILLLFGAQVAHVRFVVIELTRDIACADLLALSSHRHLPQCREYIFQS